MYSAEERALKFQHEQLRLKQLEKKRRLAELEMKRRLEDQRRHQEAQIQAKLRDMGVCPAGFRWIKQHNGYRCAGGSHLVGNKELGI